MDDIISQIINPENLYWAWEKAKKAYSQVDTLYDEIEVAAFETNLAEELQKIQKDISNESYKVSPIKPVAHPKSAKKNKPRTRQTFWISVRDQVTWIAVVNIIGPYLDRAMPFWSFGNRLYISVFPKKEESKGEIKWGFGPYRHTTKHIYRKWKQSWPFYRRCVSIVTKKMTHIRAKDGSNTDNASWYDEKEFEVMENNESLPEHLKVKYLENEYWEEQELSGEIYWASIDLKEFYPNINTDVIINNFKEYFPKDKQTPELENLFKTLLMFPIDKSGWTKSQLEKIGIRDEEICKGIPTGLFVAGFLANLALLHIDKKIDKFLSNNKKVAHFRFVDDHVFLADSYDNLKCWIEQYENLLNESGIGVKINEDKIEPEALREFYKRKKTKRAQKLDKLACYGTKLDPNYPAPLMTQTLTKISNIVKIDFDLLEESERDQIISDIEHLLITDFPDEELRRDTRISFAATMLSRLVPKIQIDITELYEIDKQKSYKRDEYKSSKEDISKYKEDSKRYKEIKNQIDQLKSNIKELNDNFKKNKKNFDKKEFISLKHTSKLMLKALRDNYEKPKLWVRAIEFCRKTGINEIDSIWEIVEELLKAKIINLLTAGFIYSLLFKTLSFQLILAYKEVSGPNVDPITLKRSKKFLACLLDEKFIESKITLVKKCKKTYERRSFSLFMFTRSVIKYYLNCSSKNINKSYNLFEYIANDNTCLICKDKYLFINMIWWILCIIIDKTSSVPPLIWYDAVKYLCHNKDIIDSPAGMAIIFLYPQELPAEIVDCVFLNKKMKNYLKYEYEGVVFDVIAGLKARQKDYDDLTQNKLVKKVSKILNFNSDMYITLYQWVEWAKKFERNSSAYDPRLSEWTALEIVKRIAEIHHSKIHIIELVNNRQLFMDADERYYRVHPSNYLLPIEWIRNSSVLSWEDWKKCIDIQHKNSKTVKLRSTGETIYDYRYTPVILDPYSCENRELSVIHGLGILLIGLLLKDFKYPAIYNPIGMQKVWVSVLKAKLEYYPVSSRTLGIINGCLSKRNLETKFLTTYQRELIPDDDTIIDPPEIFTISDFIQNVEKAQKILESYQLTVQEHGPRQLIPVSLIQLTRDYNPYKHIEEGIEDEHI